MAHYTQGTFGAFIVKPWVYFTPFSSASTIDFEPWMVVLNGWYIQLRGTQKNDFWPRARSFNFLCFFSLSIMKIIHWATSKCVKYARIRVFPDSCFPYKDRIHISVLLRENANQRKPLFWWILPVLSFLLEVHGRDNQMALKGLLKFKFYL